jgi:hypothetical protein
MPIYLITPLANNAQAIGRAVREHIHADDAYELQTNSGWLVAFKGTSVELCNLIGITPATGTAAQAIGSAMVTSIGSYYGRGSTLMWEWLKTRFENQP